MTENDKKEESSWSKIRTILSDILLGYGVVSLLVTFLVATGLTPFYEVKIERKVAVETALSVFPGSTIQLVANPKNGELRDYTGFRWILTKSSGESYIDAAEIPDVTPVEITLLPDKPGTVNVEVHAKKSAHGDIEVGRLSFQVVQTEPVVATLSEATLQVPSNLPPESFGLFADTLEIYVGENEWMPASNYDWSFDPSNAMLFFGDITGWDGTVYLRYKQDGGEDATYEVAALPVIHTSTRDRINELIDD